MNKRDLIKEVKEYAHTDPGMKFVMLLRMCIDDLRRKNDTAHPDDVLRNQGAIGELKSIIKDLKAKEKLREYSGGYDE
jgi:hypothetical protein